jgi:hypothetical protein
VTSFDPFASLREEVRFVCWDYREAPGRDKPAKVPLNPRTGGEAKVNDAASWGTFFDAYEFYLGSDSRGIGVVLGDGLVGIDLDDCIDERGEVSPLLGRSSSASTAIASIPRAAVACIFCSAVPRTLNRVGTVSPASRCITGLAT